MRTYDKFYINGQWVDPIGKGTSDVINPATGEISARVPYGNTEDVDANHETPFGGYKESGNGREFGVEGLHEYCELKAMQY